MGSDPICQFLPTKRSSGMFRSLCNARFVKSMFILGLLCAAIGVSAQTGPRNVEWRTYSGGLASPRYSPLDQINGSNFAKLQVAWRFKTDVFGARPDYTLQTTP